MERRLLQAAVTLLAFVPVAAGLAGVMLGPGFLGLSGAWPADLDSHIRYLSGLLLAMGVCWWSCVPAIEEKTARFRLLAAVTVAGGLARLLSLAEAGAPSAGHVAGLSLELGAVPLMVLWQTRVAKRFATRDGRA